MGSRLRDHTRSFDSGVRARSNSRRTLPAEGIEAYYRFFIYLVNVAYRLVMDIRAFKLFYVLGEAI